MPKYYITHAFTAKFTTEIDAENLKEATKKSNDIFATEHFGQAYDVDGDITYIEDANGNKIYEN